jgi:hypothetical protein
VASRCLKLGGVGQPDVVGIDDSMGEKRELAGGARMSAVGKREAGSSKKRNSARKAYSREYAKGSRADWAKRRSSGLRGKAGRCRGNRVDWARFLTRFKLELIFKFQWILEFGKTLRNSTMRFWKNLDMRIFPKFFRLLKDFVQNKICHAMICKLRPN